MSVRVEFDGKVFRYGTTFNGWLSDSGSDEVAQLVNAGDATPDIPSNTIAVQTDLNRSLIAKV